MKIGNFVKDKSDHFGMGEVEIKSSFLKVRVSLDYLGRSLKILKSLGKEEVIICVSGFDKPLVIGEINKKKNIVFGVAIAPIVDKEDTR